MKNIHVLPTDKETRLFIADGKLFNYHKHQQGDGVKVINQNIYITSDEEIKEGDWVIFTGEDGRDRLMRIEEYCWTTDERKIYKMVGGGLTGQDMSKKIIITTDQDLIKDGVQAIDDEFLEWFVNNPSCEKVEVIPYLKDIINPLTNEKFPDVQHRHFDETKMIFKYHYKIIIPKTTQEIIDEDFSGGLDLGQIIPKEETKQETLEETIAKGFIKTSKEVDYTEFDWTSFKLGAKWQAERMYSEEEVRHLMTLAFEQGFKKADIVEAGLEAKETDTEINWIFLKHKK